MDRAEYEKKLFRDIVFYIEKYNRKDLLSSVVLSGSFGRGEPTYIISSNGKYQLKSDVEIGLVFKRMYQKRKVEQIISKVSSRFEEDLNFMTISEKRMRKAYNFNFSITDSKYKTVFTYDLYNGSKTIWGHDFIKETHISLEMVDPYEAKRLVANRIGEFAYLQDNKSLKQSDYIRKQWKGKLLLAIASAWLICEGEYVSSYHGQFDKIKKLKKDVETQIGKGFLKEYEHVFGFLRDNGKVYEVSDEKLRNYVMQLNQYFIMQGIGKPQVNCTSRLVKYFIKYLKTGMKYGLIGYEEKIIQALITAFYQSNPELKEVADIWYKVLY